MKTPTYLYHYTSIGNAKNILASNELWASKYNRSNDHFEFSYGLNLAKDVINKFVNDTKTQNIFDKFLLFFKDEINNPTMFYYMVCFSTSHKCLYLYRNYSKGKKGSIIELKLSKKDIGHDPILVKVNYSSNYFKKTIFNIMNWYRNYIFNNAQYWLNNHCYDECCKDTFIYLIRDIFLASSSFKKFKFHLEQEVRLVSWGNDNNMKKDVISVKNSCLRIIK